MLVNKSMHFAEGHLPGSGMGVCPQSVVCEVVCGPPGDEVLWKCKAFILTPGPLYRKKTC